MGLLAGKVSAVVSGGQADSGARQAPWAERGGSMSGDCSTTRSIGRARGRHCSNGRDPRRARLVGRAEALRWGSRRRRQQGHGLMMLSDWPRLRSGTAGSVSSARPRPQKGWRPCVPQRSAGARSAAAWGSRRLCGHSTSDRPYDGVVAPPAAKIPDTFSVGSVTRAIRNAGSIDVGCFRPSPYEG